MNLPKLSLNRPVFISSLFILIIVLGVAALSKLGVELLPDVSFPVVSVTVAYPGAGPLEVETLVTKPIEDKITSLPGIKNIRSVSENSVAIIMAEFTLKTDPDLAEQKITQVISSMRKELPDDIEAPIIRAFDLASEPVATLSITRPTNLSPTKFYELTEKELAPRLQQINDVAFVDIIGGEKREIQLLLNREKLKEYHFSALQVAQSLSKEGKNIPIGPLKTATKETAIRFVGEYRSLKEIEQTLVAFSGNETPIYIKDLGKVIDGHKEIKTTSFINGKEGLSLKIFRRSKTNTVNVVKEVKKVIAEINKNYSTRYLGLDVKIVRDGARPILLNVEDVGESILIGIILTILVVYLSLKSGRSTLITGVALPNSLLGAFVLMYMAGFTINVMTLLALSLSVGLLIDDAIVVRENIFRHIEQGMAPKEAALEGTLEVMLAVIATTFTILSVFGSVAFLQGIVGQFFKEFGLTICFAMVLGLLDSLTMAPMLSAYFSGTKKERKIPSYLLPLSHFTNYLSKTFFSFLHLCLNFPKTTLLISFLLFLSTLFPLMHIPKTFVAPEDSGEFAVTLELPIGTNLETTSKETLKIEQLIRSYPEVAQTYSVVGTSSGQTYKSSIIIQLVDAKKRTGSTSDFKEKTRSFLLPYKELTPKVKEAQEADAGDWAERPFMVAIIGNNFSDIEKSSNDLFAALQKNQALKDVDMTYRPGNPEVHLRLKEQRAKQLGVNSTLLGMELRTQIEGVKVGTFRQEGEEYDIHTFLEESQRDIKKNFGKIQIPNMNYTQVRLSDVTHLKEETAPSAIHHHNRLRYIAITADINPDGAGLGKAIDDLKVLMKKLPSGVTYKLMGDALLFEELIGNMLLALTLSVMFIYLVLASLYNSFLTPFMIMLVLPLAASGAFYALWLFGGILDVYSMIGCILLFGIATKNSILLVDYIKKKGLDHIEEAVKIRLRPILMTSMALICGMLPISIGLNEASKQRTSMGIAVTGGLITSTLLTLVVIPACYALIKKWKHRSTY